LEETLKAFEDNGMQLPADQLAQLTTWKQELSELESQFSTNLNQDKSTLEFSETELTGVPEDFLKSLQKTSDGKYIVTTKEPHYVRIMENASSGETRRRMITAYENRVAKKNTELLERAILIRQKIATLLGYTTWADYRIHRRMAKDSATVLTFLNGLKEKLSARNKEDLSNLQTFKKEKEKIDGPLNPWDIRYYSNLMQKEKFNLDSEKVREYFPADRVISGLFSVYSTLLGVEFVERKDAVTWDASVKMYEIINKSNKKLLAYFFADFFPRPGKYGHAAAFNLISGRQIGSHYSLPVSSIVANFSAAENGKPSLLPHEEVDTIFHEFGHIMHQTLTRAPYGSLSGSSVDQDFVEAPSQMLENWVYSPEILDMVSGHYLDPSKKLPKAMVQKIIAKRDFNQGYYYTRQLMLALADMSYATASGAVDTTAVYRSLFKEVMGLEPVEGTHFQASFGHLMSGYDAGYYGYLWSEVYAADMFTRFETEGLLNSTVGHQYRKYILEPGKMKDANVLLTQFLGRKPNSNAFFKKLHIPTTN
jgi:thimet oligopeptidase